MKILRSILAVVVGVVAAVVAIMALQMISFLVYRPDNGKTFWEQMKEMQENKEAAKALMAATPTGGLVVVLVSWELGAFVGGGLAALIAGRGRLVHAGIIGAFILASTILNIRNTQREYDFSHPDWMIVLGLLLPIPVSLVAGKLVSLLFPPAPPVPPS
jgi:hypothetical protein